MSHSTSPSEPIESDWLAKMAPAQVVTRSGTMLRMVAQGLHDMKDADHDRLLFGFLSVVVFGRSMTLVMQNLRSHDRATFDTWYAPWQKEMQADPLMKYFNDLRTKVIHEDAPAIGIVLTSFGPEARPVGSIRIEGWPVPISHLGKSIEDISMTNLCEIYYGYLNRMFEACAVGLDRTAATVWLLLARLCK